MYQQFNASDTMETEHIAVQFPLVSITVYNNFNTPDTRKTAVQLHKKIRPPNKTQVHHRSKPLNFHGTSNLSYILLHRHQNIPHHAQIYTYMEQIIKQHYDFIPRQGRTNSQCISQFHTQTKSCSIVATILAVIIPCSWYHLLFHPLCSLLLLVLHPFTDC